MDASDLGMSVTAGCRLALEEMYGDWYRDPWGWPEYQWLSKNPGSFAVREFVRKEDSTIVLAHPASFHTTEIPKNRLAVRPAVIQDSLSRIMYAIAVASHIGRLQQTLPEWVYGWRVRDDTRISKNRLEWARYLEAVPTDVDGLYGLQIDITSFFASIKVDRLAEMVFQRIGKTAAAGVIWDILRQHDSLMTRSGIPQRSFASAALAHVYLGAVDDALHVGLSSGLTAVVRWMDDITAFGAEEKLYSAYLDIQDRVRQLGLEPNAAKTTLTDASQAVDAIQAEGLNTLHIPRHVVWAASGMPTTVDDLTTLQEFEEEILSAPEKRSRTWLRATLRSLIEHGVFRYWEKWLAAAPRIPHAMDALGRYLRACGEQDEDDPGCDDYWSDLTDWFGSYCQSEWSKLDWVSSQLALTFPASRATGAVTDVLLKWLSTSNDAQQVAISAQRLAATRPVDCRDIIRARIDKVSDPVLLRIFALGLLSAAADRSVVRSILERDPSNSLVTLMLEDNGWRCPATTKDFDTDHTD